MSTNDDGRNGTPPRPLRSSRWFSGGDINGFNHRAWLKPNGFSDEALRDRPVIGICNTWSEMVGCNVHLRGLAEAVKRGVLQAGGLPLEFPVLSLSETLMKPNAMLYRNLASMDVESMLKSHPIDAVVLLASCDKTTPAVLMGAASANVPAILVTGGPQVSGHFRGKPAGSGTDFWHYSYEVRLGRMSLDEYRDFEGSLCRSHGHCMEMATAMSMAVVAEAMGITLPDNASIPAVDSRRLVLAERSGRRAVELARERVRPSDILTRPAFENAIRVLMAIGGSTNAVVHLLAIAGRLGLDLRLADFAAASRVPVLANLKPSGEYLLDDFFHAGGVPALMGEMRDLLNMDLPTVAGGTLDQLIGTRRSHDNKVIRPLSDPIKPWSAIAVLHGNLAPHGAVVKRSAASSDFFRHRGPALVFESVDDLNRRLDDPDLDVTPESVIVLKNGGPVGGPGMPEWGHIPVPGKLRAAGVQDMVRLSDARISGGSHGLMIVHVAPEAAVGGPIAAVENGDVIAVDVDAGRLDMEVSAEEIARRLAARPSRPPRYRRGWEALYLDQVLQADEGCDLKILRKLPGEYEPELPHGLISGWMLGD
jgi:dihydroxy-acid dehydratase